MRLNSASPTLPMNWLLLVFRLCRRTSAARTVALPPSPPRPPIPPPGGPPGPPPAPPAPPAVGVGGRRRSNRCDAVGEKVAVAMSCHDCTLPVASSRSSVFRVGVLDGGAPRRVV